MAFLCIFYKKILLNSVVEKVRNNGVKVNRIYTFTLFLWENVKKYLKK